MAAPQTSTQARAGPIDNRDVEEWTQRFNEVLAKPGEVIHSSSPASAQSWNNSLFACFNPIDLCLVSCCLPCVTFGKTHHRLNRDANLDGYEPVNTSCLLFCASSCVGLHWIPAAMQRAQVRAKFHLQGTCLGDLALSCCCACCSLVQQEKEAQEKAPPAAQAIQQEYQPSADMAYPGKR
ncbi:PLAC8-domain-containing protein [Sodiomyces alkalinus F11]|uniref:PLAC8-domain-containing protein n=1 Tax=Sodiomyces alkalinus (strain CBS 110278 / VKM F-3762 / F11) TaxID=1314773 RepID=A0A3N2Q5Q8_SODAK|nr:PLAC8-domain-containing protein [Sodiomyces alkalinus F11]ROT42036.1 PLAC8-domain-containing protein [Sodiomyces alkalinus F11]